MNELVQDISDRFESRIDDEKAGNSRNILGRFAYPKAQAEIKRKKLQDQKLEKETFTVYEALIKAVQDQKACNIEPKGVFNESSKDIFKITKAPASERGRIHEPKGRGRALTDFTEYMKHCNDIISNLEEEIEQAGGNNPKK